MLSTQAYHDHEFLKEVWGLFGVGVTILVVRSLVRLRAVGLRHFQGDDYMTILVLACYTADAITVTLTYLNGSNVDYTPEQLAKFSEEQLANIVFGSKMQLLAWYTYTALVWSLKACMLFFFNRLTFGLDAQTLVRVLGVVCGITYLAVFLTITVGCHPIQHNWEVMPYPPKQCTLRAQNMYVSTVLNVLTDGAMLCIPLPLLWKLKVPLTRKLTLAALLCSGIFVITAAIVRIVMSLKSNPSALTINRWGVRETIAGILAVNVPILRALFTRSFWSGQIPSQQNVSKSHVPSSRSRLASSLRKPDAFEMIDPFKGTSDNKGSKSDTTAIAHPVGSESYYYDDDATSQDSIIQQRYTSAMGRRPDEERGESHLGVLVSTTLTQNARLRSPGPPAELAGQPSGATASSDGEMWDRHWRDIGYGNSVTVSPNLGERQRR